MAVTAAKELDAQRLRADFPYLEELQDGKPVAFLDSAASTQKPRQVLDAMRDFYETSYANVHRGVYRLAERATEGLEGAREKVRGFVNAPAAREVDVHPQRHRGDQSRRLFLGVRTSSAPGDVVSSPSSSTTRTSSPGSTSRAAPARASA